MVKKIKVDSISKSELNSIIKINKKDFDYTLFTKFLYDLGFDKKNYFIKNFKYEYNQEEIKIGLRNAKDYTDTTEGISNDKYIVNIVYGKNHLFLIITYDDVEPFNQSLAKYFEF